VSDEMYFTLDDIKEIADDVREVELRKELTCKLTHYKLDFSGKLYRDEIVKALCRVPLDYLRLMAPRFNDESLLFKDLQKTANDLRNLPKSRVKSELSVDDRSRRYLDNSFFKPQEISDFVAKKAEAYRAEKTATLTLVSFNNYQERLKVEDDVIIKYEDGICFFKALEEVCKRDSKYEFIRGSIVFAKLFLQGRFNKTKELRNTVEDELKRYITNPKSTQQALKP
jgi:hypothetical protein